MKRVSWLFFIALIGITPFILASGGSDQTGGGGGGGKSGKIGTPSPVDTGAWRNATLTADWRYAGTPAVTSCGCPGNGGAPGGGECYPMAKSNNTYPNNPAQNVSGAPSDYYSRVTVTNTGIVPSWAPTSMEFEGGPRSGIKIKIPFNQPYEILFEYYDGCTRCLHPGMVSIPNLFEGRRIYWRSKSIFMVNNTNPITFPSWYTTSPIRMCN